MELELYIAGPEQNSKNVLKLLLQNKPHTFEMRFEFHGASRNFRKTVTLKFITQLYHKYLRLLKCVTSQKVYLTAIGTLRIL